MNTQVEAALAQGLSFKDKFRNSTRQRATVSGPEDDCEAAAAAIDASDGDDDGEGAAMLGPATQAALHSL